MSKNVYKILNPKRESIFACRASKYNLKYEKGSEVKAVPGSLGIFCFRRKIDVLDFMLLYRSDYLIVKVKPIGRGKRPAVICASLSNYCFDDFYENGYDTSIPPSGTICYPSVLVLE